MQQVTTHTAFASSLMSRYGMFAFMALAILAGTLISPDAMASASSGGGMPWDSTLAKLQASVTGPYAFVASLIGIIGTLSVLLFGGDLSGIFKTVLTLALIVSCVIGANNLLMAFTGRGAEITALIDLTLAARIV